MQPMNQKNRSPIVFFDGVCGLCNRFVQFLLAIDKRRIFKVATLQGAAAKLHLSVDLRENLTSLVVVTRDGIVLTKSRAVLAVFREIGGAWGLVYFLVSWIPPIILDRLYNTVAAHRYRWFGKREICRVPTTEEREQFLD